MRYSSTCRTLSAMVLRSSTPRAWLLFSLMTFLTCLLLASSASADDCQTFLKTLVERVDPSDPSIYVTMVTLNNRSVGSFGDTRLYYLKPSKGRRGGIPTFPGRFVTLEANHDGADNPKFDYGLETQVFSDRVR